MKFLVLIALLLAITVNGRDCGVEIQQVTPKVLSIVKSAYNLDFITVASDMVSISQGLPSLLECMADENGEQNNLEQYAPCIDGIFLALDILKDAAYMGDFSHLSKISYTIESMEKECILFQNENTIQIQEQQQQQQEVQIENQQKLTMFDNQVQCEKLMVTVVPKLIHMGTSAATMNIFLLAYEGASLATQVPQLYECFEEGYTHFDSQQYKPCIESVKQSYNLLKDAIKTKNFLELAVIPTNLSQKCDFFTQETSE